MRKGTNVELLSFIILLSYKMYIIFYYICNSFSNSNKDINITNTFRKIKNIKPNTIIILKSYLYSTYTPYY